VSDINFYVAIEIWMKNILFDQMSACRIVFGLPIDDHGCK
jgi:hypothetical protein